MTRAPLLTLCILIRPPPTKQRFKAQRLHKDLARALVLQRKRQDAHGAQHATALGLEQLAHELHTLTLRKRGAMARAKLQQERRYGISRIRHHLGIHGRFSSLATLAMNNDQTAARGV